MIMDVLNARSDRFSMLIQSLQTAELADTLQKGYNLFLYIFQFKSDELHPFNFK